MRCTCINQKEQVYVSVSIDVVGKSYKALEELVPSHLWFAILIEFKTKHLLRLLLEDVEALTLPNNLSIIYSVPLLLQHAGHGIHGVSTLRPSSVLLAKLHFGG